MEVKYKVGDVLEVLFWEPDLEDWTQGIICISKYIARFPHTDYGVFETTVLHNDKSWVPLRFTAISAEQLQTKGYIRYLGNMNSNEALRTLYGSPEKQTNQPA